MFGTLNFSSLSCSRLPCRLRRAVFFPSVSADAMAYSALGASKAKRAIRGTVVMISGCKDSQTSADVGDTAAFGIDNGPGGAGGACTNSMIQALQQDPSPTWAGLLQNMRTILRRGSYTQVPMLSASHRKELKKTSFSVVDPNGGSSSKRRAVLVGINYVGTKAELRGCHNDVETMKRYLQSQGYEESDMRILMDDGNSEMPTHKNIHAAMRWLVEDANPGDSLFFHYSGHGTSMRDDDGDEADGKDEALVPVDYESAGLARDDEILETLVLPVKKGVLLTCVFDCCHSGTIMDLPYVFKADNESAFDNPSMNYNTNFKTDLVMGLAAAIGLPVGSGCDTACVIGCCADFAADCFWQTVISAIFGLVCGVCCGE